MRKSKATEAFRVATDIAAIRAALKQHGYTLRKHPKQVAWTISLPLTPPRIQASPSTLPLPRGTGRVTGEITAKERYLLTYQPAPISAWVLHPQHNNPNRRTLLTIIQNATTKQPTHITRTIP